MNITIAQLIGAIREATKEKTVRVSSTDYYSRPGDTEDGYITYVCPHALIDVLQEIGESEEK